MTKRPNKDWIYDEFTHVGVDYSDREKVTVYDDEMESFRDFDEEVKRFVKRLNVPNHKELTVIDIGCGTGAFSIHGARYFKKVYGVDVSKEMLKAASSKAEALGIDNIKFCYSSFLSFQLPEGEEADIITTKWAFHHLPDYWKQAAILNMNKMVKTGGLLYITDLLFTFDPEYEKNTDALLEDISKNFGDKFLEEAKTHIRDEYSTFDWILEGLLERGGFEVKEVDTEDPLASEYICVKVKSF